MNSKLTLFVAASAMSLLASCGSSKERVLLYSTAEEERIVFLQEELNKKFPNYEIVIQEIGTGALISKLQAEGTSTECDIVQELEITNMEVLLKENKDFFYTLEGYDFDKFTAAAVPFSHKKYAPECMTSCSIIYNKSVLEEKGLSVPTTYADLLKPEYKGLISMPNPKSSGTGYAFYNGLVSEWGKDAALTYFDSLNANIKEFTTSGSTPIKGVDRGEIAIGFAMTWQCVEYAAKNDSLAYSTLDEAAPYNLYEMAIVNGKQTRPAVKEVFDYMFNELNQKDVEKFVPDPVYKNYVPENPNYPKDIELIEMQGIGNPEYKQSLLDAWKF